MADSRQSVGATVYGEFVVYDILNAAVTGLVQAGFTILVSVDGVAESKTVTITEVGSGRYAYTITLDVAGHWSILITHTTYNPRGWFEDFFVVGVVANSGTAGGGGRRRALQNLALRDRLVRAELDEEDALTVLLLLGADDDP